MKKVVLMTGYMGKGHGGGQPRRPWAARRGPPNPDKEKENNQGKLLGGNSV